MSRKSKYSLTDEEEARIQAEIAADPDHPEMTDEQIAQARPFAEVFPELAEQIRRSRGRPKLEAAKEPVTLRLPPAMVKSYQERGGEKWRSLMLEILEQGLASGVLKPRQRVRPKESPASAKAVAKKTA